MSSVVSNALPSEPIVDPQTGRPSFAWIKWFQGVGNTVNRGFDQQGNYQGPIGANATIAGRQFLSTIIQNLTSAGLLSSDFVTDGAGSPIIGGKTAYAALIASAPASGQTLRFNGTVWLPVALAESIAKSLHQWLDSYDAASGVFTQSQPSFVDLAGTANPSQLPVLSALNGQITNTQLPSDGISATITTAKLTPGGAQGSMTFTNGILMAQVQAT